MMIRRIASGLRRRLLQRRFRSYRAAEPLVAGKAGLEIGGPSSLFARGGPLPLYAAVGRLDNCVFSTSTVWQERVEAGDTFVYDRRHPPGHQYIGEAADLAMLAPASYAFVLSSHTIEHSANPLRVLAAWRRVLQDRGALVMVVPHKDGTFDHRRPVTTIDHLVKDFDQGTQEDDLTHLPEILDRHDLTMDPAAGDIDAFRARSERNLENRCLHHHVFDTSLVVQLLDRAGFQIVSIEPVLPYHIVAVAEQRPAAATIDNAAFFDRSAAFYRRSPFAGDRG
jgi:hypothetical protein